MASGGAPVTVAPPTLARELRVLAPFLLLSVAAWVGLGLAARFGQRPAGVERAPWQHSFLALPPDGQRLYRAVREGVFEIESRRGATGAWPEVSALAEDLVPPFAADRLLPALAWTRARDGLYVTYLGRPRDGAGLDWLVLFIEPEPKAFADGAATAPVDEEHHTLADGTALHVTVWTRPAGAPAPAQVVAFPLADGFVQQVGRE